MKFAIVVEKLGKVLVVQLTPTELVVAALNPVANSLDEHCDVEILDELKLEVLSEEQLTFSFPLESVVNELTLSDPEHDTEVPKVSPRTPLGIVT